MQKYKMMGMRMSKGSKQRPRKVNQQEFDKNWNNIFNKKKKKNGN